MITKGSFVGIFISVIGLAMVWHWYDYRLALALSVFQLGNDIDRSNRKTTP